MCVSVCVEVGEREVFSKHRGPQVTGWWRLRNRAYKKGWGSSQVKIKVEHDQGLDGGDGLHVVRQVSQKHICIKEDLQLFPLSVN